MQTYLLDVPLDTVSMLFIELSFSGDIWVQVRKRPLNKKELAKNEEDIIETYSNSLTVHETKLKASFSVVFSTFFYRRL